MCKRYQKLRIELGTIDGNATSFETVDNDPTDSGSADLGHAIGWALRAVTPYVHRALWMKDFLDAMCEAMEIDIKEMLKDSSDDSVSVH